MYAQLILDKKEQDAVAPELASLLGRVVEKEGKVKRLQTAIRTRVRLARNAPDATVDVGGTEYSRKAGTVNQEGFGIVTNPGWTVDPDDPFRARITVNGKPRSVRWLVQETSGVEHHLTALDIKVDSDLKVYCLARYASLELESECITCRDGTVVCGIDPQCK